MTDGNKKLGYISIYRSIKDHWIWQDPIKFQWWISLLLEVNFKDRKVLLGNDLVECKRGQTVKSLKHFAELWSTTRDTARNFLVLLEKDGMILRKNLHKSTQITICNYDSYQDNLRKDQTDDKRNPNERQTDIKQETNKEQTHSDTNNNGNKENQCNNDIKVNKFNKKVLMSKANALDVTEKNREYFKIASSFYQLFQYNSTQQLNVEWKHLEDVKAENCCNDIRLAIEQDNRTEEDFRLVWSFLKSDDFWMQNIQSTKKLREKFDQLITKAKNQNHGKSKQSFSEQANKFLAENDPDYNKY